MTSRTPDRGAAAQHDHPALPGPVGAGRRRPAHPGRRSRTCCAAARSTGAPRTWCCATAGRPRWSRSGPSDPDPLFSPVAELRVLSGPDATAVDRRPGDATSATPPSLAARRARAPARRRARLRGAGPVRARQLHLAARAAPGSASPRSSRRTRPSCWPWPSRWSPSTRTCPPVDLVLDAVDVREPGGGQPGRRTTCCPAGAAASTGQGDVSFLDTPPALPRRLAADRLRALPPVPPALLRRRNRAGSTCARGPGRPGRPASSCSPSAACWNGASRSTATTAVVPWGANLDEVRAALRALCGLPAAEPSAVATGRCGTGCRT